MVLAGGHVSQPQRDTHFPPACLFPHLDGRSIVVESRDPNDWEETHTYIFRAAVSAPCLSAAVFKGPEQGLKFQRQQKISRQNQLFFLQEGHDIVRIHLATVESEEPSGLGLERLSSG